MMIYPIVGILGVGRVLHAIDTLLSALTHPLNFIATEIGKGVTTAVDGLGNAMASSSQITFGTRYVALFDLGFHLAIIIAIGALLYGAAAAALSGEIKRLVDTIVRVIFAIIGSFALLTLVMMAQNVIFHIDQGIATTFSASNRQVGAGVAASLAATIAASVLSGAGAAIAITLGVLAIVGALILWSVLLMSTAILYVACFFGPLAFVISAKAGKKVLELVVAMLLVPFVITSVIAVGIAVLLDGGGLASTIPHFIMATGLLYVAIFSPLAILRFMPLAESHIAQLRHPHQAIQGASSQISSKSRSFKNATGRSSGSSGPLSGDGATGGSSGAASAAGGATAGGIAAAVAAGKAAKAAADKTTVGTFNAATDTVSGSGQVSPGKASPPGSGGAKKASTPAEHTDTSSPPIKRVSAPPSEQQT